MAVNKRKILESARKLAQKGAKAKALKEYAKLQKLDPKDAKLRLEIGDAYRRWGQVDEAIDTYSKVAQQYASEGFDARSVAVYKQILNLDSERFEAYAPLAELYERMGLTAEAIAALQTAADGFHRRGDKEEALSLLRQMANVDPSNTTSRIKVADLLRQEGKQEDAIHEYQLAAQELERAGDVEKLAGVYRRILEVDDTQVAALGALARNLSSRGKASEAIPLAERALQLDDANVERYELLAGLYDEVGRESDRVGTYRALADIYRTRGDEDQARSILQRYVPSGALDVAPDAPEEEAPDELSGDAILASAEELFGDGMPENDSDAELDLGLGDGDAVGRADAPPMANEQSPVDGSTPESAQGEAVPGAADTEQLIAEASVYLRYGKHDKAVAHLENVLAASPGHRDALEKLGEAFAESGDSEKAVESWLSAAEAARESGDDAALRVLRGRIAALDEEAAGRLEPELEVEPLVADTEAADAGSAAVAAPEPEALPELDLDLPGDDDEGIEIDLDLSVDIEDSTDPEVSFEVISDDEVFESEEPAAAAPSDAASEIEFDLDGAADLESELAAEGEADLDADLDTELDADLGEDLAASPPALETDEPATPPVESLAENLDAQVDEDLEEADFYMQQGLIDEAEAIYQRVLTAVPNQPVALEKLAEVSATRAARGPSAPTEDDVEPVPEVEVESGVASEVASEASETAIPDALPEERGPDVSDPELEVAAELADAGLDDPEPALPSPDEVEELGDLDLDADEAEQVAASTGNEQDTEEFEPNLDSPEAPMQAADATDEEGGDGGFDLAAALSDAFDDDNESPASSGGDDGFEAVFHAFKKGVSETLGEGDHQAHYDLAIAYKEMGLLDDAIDELRSAMGDPARSAECLQLIGICAIDADRAPLAVEHLEQLLALPDLSAEQGVAARFDLGRAFQGMGDVDAARTAWEAVAEAQPGFQNVEEHLAGLGKPDPEEPVDDDFESFDDVMEAVREDDEPEASAGENFDDLVAEANRDDDSTPKAEAQTAPQTSPDPPPRRKKKKISF